MLQTDRLPHRLAGMGGTQMRDELQAAFPNAHLHPMGCDCGHCRLSGDPIAARRERFVRLQAAVLGGLAVVFYLMALFLAPQILAALQPLPERIAIEGVR